MAAPIKDGYFSILPPSIQPLVENGIQHGKQRWHLLKKDGHMLWDEQVDKLLQYSQKAPGVLATAGEYIRRRRDSSRQHPLIVAYSSYSSPYYPGDHYTSLSLAQRKDAEDALAQMLTAPTLDPVEYATNLMRAGLPPIFSLRRMSHILRQSIKGATFDAEAAIARWMKNTGTPHGVADHLFYEDLITILQHDLTTLRRGGRDFLGYHALRGLQIRDMQRRGVA